jgi:Resolvase, N terminal domain
MQKASVPFRAADMPHADNFTVGLMALMAQREREMISERTKAALAAAKARGKALGWANEQAAREHLSVRQHGSHRDCRGFREIRDGLGREVQRLLYHRRRRMRDGFSFQG